VVIIDGGAKPNSTAPPTVPARTGPCASRHCGSIALSLRPRKRCRAGVVADPVAVIPTAGAQGRAEPGSRPARRAAPQGPKGLDAGGTGAGRVLFPG